MKLKFAVLVPFLILIIACAETFDERVAREAKEYTEKNCPFPLSKELAMDSMTFTPRTRTISYYYSLSPNYDSEHLDVENTKHLLLTQLKNQPSLIKYKEAALNFRYVYYELVNPEHILVDVTFKEKDYR